MINELKVGDSSILDSVSGYEIVKVPGGFIYKNEYAGIVFVPDSVPSGASSSARLISRKVEK
jgi:hypothetical protein